MSQDTGTNISRYTPGTVLARIHFANDPSARFIIIGEPSPDPGMVRVIYWDGIPEIRPQGTIDAFYTSIDLLDGRKT